MSNTTCQILKDKTDLFLEKGPQFHLDVFYDFGALQKVNLERCTSPGLSCNYYSSERDPILESAVNQWLFDYCNKSESNVLIPFNFKAFPTFTKKVMQIIYDIPIGKTRTYGEIAEIAGSPRAARAVGSVCCRNPFIFFVPCHRVLAGKNLLSQYSAGGPTIKRELLDFEGG